MPARIISNKYAKEKKIITIEIYNTFPLTFVELRINALRGHAVIAYASANIAPSSTIHIP